MPTELATQFDLLAQGSNLEDWGDLLIIAIMAILWLAGGLAKVLSGRKGPRQEGQANQQTRKRETWQERLARKAEEMRRAAEAASGPAEQRARAGTQTPQPSSPPGRITLRTDQKGDSVMVYEHPAGQSTVEREEQAARRRAAERAALAARRQAANPPSIETQIGAASPTSEPAIRGTTAAMGEPPRPLEPAVTESQALRESDEGFHPVAIIDDSDPDALRKAILHYEILGKPLALREPSDEPLSF